MTAVAPWPEIQPPGARRQLESEGYCIVPLLSSAETADVAAFASEALPAHAPVFYGPHRGDDPATRAAVHRHLMDRLGEQVSALLNGQLPFWASLLTKSPGADGELDLHHDWSFVDEHRHRSGVVWVPLQPTGPDQGGLVVVPRSHLSAPVRRGSVPWPDTLALERESLLDQAVPLEVEAGSAVIYDNRLVHGSLANRSDGNRHVAVFGFTTPGATLVHHTVVDGSQPVAATVEPEFFLRQRLGSGLEGDHVGPLTLVDEPQSTSPQHVDGSQRTSATWSESPRRRRRWHGGPVSPSA